MCSLYSSNYLYPPTLRFLLSPGRDGGTTLRGFSSLIFSSSSSRNLCHCRDVIVSCIVVLSIGTMYGFLVLAIALVCAFFNVPVLIIKLKLVLSLSNRPFTLWLTAISEIL